jgi:tRNA-specific 2-thiouridylase
VFYDAPAGQARVLGGGFIQSASAKSAAAKGVARPQPFVEAMRG